MSDLTDLAWRALREALEDGETIYAYDRHGRLVVRLDPDDDRESSRTEDALAAYRIPTPGRIRAGTYRLDIAGHGIDVQWDPA